MFEEPQRTRLKICGINTLEHARYASGARADFIGFIFYKKSPRYIEPFEAGAIISWLEGPEPVGVFVNESIDDVNDLALISGVNYVQLHGDESPDYCKLIDKPIIKAIRVSEETTTAEIQSQLDAFEGLVEYFLFDTSTKDKFGGTGTTFPHQVLHSIETPHPYFVAGGINVTNVSSIINDTEPYGVDVSGSLEIAPGVKDFDLMADFFDQMHEIWTTQPSD